MTEKVIVITTDNTISINELEIIDGSILDGLKEIVGGWIEIVRPMYLKHPLVLVCNEEGLIHELPFNLVGSALYGYAEHGQPIVGDIAIVEKVFRDGEPDIGGINEDTIQQIYDQFITKFPILKGE